MNKHFCFASVISEIQQSDMFMTVKARIFETPKANLNGVRVTPAFLSEIVENEERYVGLPLYADVRALKSGNYNRLGHLYDTRTGEFHSTQNGSFYQFSEEEFDGGSYLIGYARIPKRDKKLSKAIAELFSDGALKFSFEIAVGECEEQEDGTTLIDVSENNYLEGTAIVTFPACEDAVALEFVAQRQADDSEGGETEMAEVETKAEVLETEATTEVAETEVEAEEETACKDKKKAEEEISSEEEKETASVVIHECHQESDSVYAIDTESGADVHQTVSVETCVSRVEPDAQIVEDVDGVKIAEGEETPGESTPANGDGNQTGTSETGGSGNGNPDSGTGGTGNSGAGGTDGSGGSGGSDASGTGGTGGSGGSGGAGGSGGSGSAPATNTVEDLPVVEDTKKKTAEQLIAELTEAVSTLKAEIEALKESKTLTASAKQAEMNPFMGSINSEKKFSLLDKAERNENFSLLEKA